LEPDYSEPDFKSIEMRERLAMIKPIMESKLSESERMVLDLAYSGGYNFDEIGTMLTPKVTRSAVQQTHARALKKLRAELGRQKKLS
jgi:DNA-directed RNA polymerase specialized sigma subunit